MTGRNIPTVVFSHVEPAQIGPQMRREPSIGATPRRPARPLAAADEPLVPPAAGDAPSGRLKAAADAGVPPHTVLNRAVQKGWITGHTESHHQRRGCTMTAFVPSLGEVVEVTGRGGSRAEAKAAAAKKLVRRLVEAGL